MGKNSFGLWLITTFNVGGGENQFPPTLKLYRVHLVESLIINYFSTPKNEIQINYYGVTTYEA